MNHDRETPHLFDLMFKYILQEASHPALVHFINGLFDKAYPPDSPVAFTATESVRPVDSHLAALRSDMMLTVAKDAYLIEAQIGEDETIALRVFQYSVAYAQTTKVIDGECITLRMPEARIIYWEAREHSPDLVRLRIIFPDRSEHDYEVFTVKMLKQGLEEVERRRLVLLVPFYVLKYRQEVKDSKTSAERRRELAGELRDLLGELEALVDRSCKQGIISAVDAVGIFERVVQMYNEVYGSYREFKEAVMQLEERVRTHWQDYLQQGIHQGIQQGMHQGMQQGMQQGIHQGKLEERNRLISLLEQGYTLNQIKALLAEESGQDRSGGYTSQAASPAQKS